MKEEPILGNERIKVILSDHLPHKAAGDIIVRNNTTISSLSFTINTLHLQLKYR